MRGRALVFVVLVLCACRRLPEPPTLFPEITAASLEQTVYGLVGFDTRHTASEGIVAARAWLKKEFEAIEGLEVVLQSFRTQKSRRIAEGVELVNVYGKVTGSRAPQRVLVVSGHYDSRASDVMDAAIKAPGANDDASGTAVVLELARYFAAHPPEATMIFLCVAGEEQGLLGSRHFARKAREAKWNVVLHFDWDPAIARPLKQARGRPADYWPLYRSLRGLPVLAIRGALSEVLSPATFARMAAEKPDLIQLTLPEVGHAPMLDEPETEPVIDDFLARIDAQIDG